MQRNYLHEIQENKIALSEVPDSERTEEICLAAVRKNGLALQFVPEDKLTKKICKTALNNVSEKERIIQYIPADSNFSDMIFLSLVKQKGYYLKFIPENKCSDELYMAAVKQNGYAIQYVPKSKYTKALLIAAVSQNALALRNIPEVECTEAIYIAAVKQIGLVLTIIPVDKHTEAIYKAAVQQDGLVLKAIPKENRKRGICLLAIEQNGLALQFVPENLLTEKLCLIAIKKYGLALQFVPENLLTQELCLAAVEQNTLSLEFTPEEYKENIIYQLSVKEILSNNYLAKQYFPNSQSYQDQIKTYLETVTHIIVNESKSDYELYDIELTYANKHQNKISISMTDEITVDNIDEIKDNINQLFTDIANTNSNQTLHLVLIGHGNEDTTKVAGLDSETIADLCQKHPRIEHITLLGCNLAKSNITKKEKEMIENLSKKTQKKKNIRYGLVTTYQAELNENNFQEKCLAFCKKNQLNGTYIINKLNDNQYQLCIIKYKENNTKICTKTINIPENRIKHLNHILEKQKKPFSFPNQSRNELIPVRKKENPLSAKELYSLRAIKYEQERFAKTHPKYKNDKATYPFLATLEVEAKELKPSFLQKVTEAIQENQHITRNITIKGPRKFLHVDAPNRNFLITRTHLYSSKYNCSYFNSNKSIIHYDKLKEERQKDIKKIKHNHNDEQYCKSGAKQIRVKINKS